MAPPSKSAPRPWRALSALAVIILVMLIAITGKDTFSPGSWHKDFKVALGLDLASGTQVTLKAQTFNGKPPQAGEMDQAISIMEARVNGTGNSGAQVQKQGTDLINVSVPNAGSKQVLSLVDTTAQLWFRQVLLTSVVPGGTATTPSPTPSTTPSGSPSSSSSPSPKASPSPSSSASTKASTKAKVTGSGGAAQPLTTSAHAVASPSPSASAKASASPSASSSPAPLPTATTPTSAASATVGDASKVQPAVLKAFNQMVCKPGTNGNVNDSWKKQIRYTPANWDNENAQVVSCDAQGIKYVLDVAKVTGKDVTSAQAGLSQTSADWQVNLGFNGAGTKAFGDLTTTQFDKYYPGAQQGNQTDATLDRIAIVLDGDVMSAPETQGAIVGGNAQITGNFTQEQATSLANVLKYGALPLTFNVQNTQTVSAQLASSSLDAGLIAAAIGLGLVVVYSFLYYRGLGLVSVSSLVIAGLLSWLAVILLSKYNGFAMELSGIAGLIVAIGITADSFVVFFERLRDEVREGRPLRPAVESGWRRARRTILVSDTVSFLAALLLYYFAIGEVKGFAYTLGLTTIIDILVVFLFTHPMITVLARTNFYGRGHKMSGLDPARLGARAPWRSSLPRTVRTRPASASRTRTTSTPEEA